MTRSVPFRVAAMAVLCAGALVTVASCSDDDPSHRRGPGPVPVHGSSSRPLPVNVLMIVMDTTRADHCTFNGYERPTTPRLAEFAREAVVYRNAWVPAGWTGPSHASLFTGLRPRHHGYVAGRMPMLPEDAETLAEMLAAKGWTTGGLSNNILVSADFGLTQGFQFAPRIFTIPDRPLPHCRDAHRRALEFVRSAKRNDERFFLFLNDFEPHLPYEPPERFQRAFLRGSPPANLLAAARDWNNPYVLAHIVGVQRAAAALLDLLPDLYDAELAGLDAEIGDFLDEVRRLGLLDDTMVVILGDHGENLGEHGLWDHRFSLHATVRHVPLLIRYPGGERGGSVVDDLVRSEDILPTVLDVCGLATPAGLDGASLLGDLSGRISRASYGRQHEDGSHFREEFPGADPPEFLWSIEAVYDGRRHLIQRSDGHVELYDHATDPREEHNVADESPDVVTTMKRLLDH